MDAIEGRQAYQPTVETRNRKPLRDNPLASWELRVGAMRVYYKVVVSAEPIVFILAIGVKEGNVVRIGREVVTL